MATKTHPLFILGSYGDTLFEQLQSLDIDMGELNIVYGFDTAGNVISETVTDIATNKIIVLKEYTYDLSGNVVTETVTKGVNKYRKTFIYDINGSVERIEIRKV